MMMLPRQTPLHQEVLELVNAILLDNKYKSNIKERGSNGTV